MTNAELSEDDEGKPVVDGDGNRVGTVHDVDFSAVKVATETDLDDPARELEDHDGKTIYELQEKQVSAVTDDEVRIDLGG